MPDKEEPRYDHDCVQCVFIGHVREYDVYLCPQAGYPTILGRYGDEADEYVSGNKLTLFTNRDIRLGLSCSRLGGER